MITSVLRYNPGTGLVTFTPTWPPTGKQPVDAMSAVRHDSITTAGLKQSVLERIDALNPVEFKNVPQSDIASWQSFMSWALAGGSFDYSQDSGATFETYTLEDTDWAPKWVAPQVFSLSFTMRKLVT